MTKHFTLTCKKPYTRHHYELVFSNGQSEQYKFWDQVQARWFEVPGQFLTHINVLDK